MSQYWIVKQEPSSYSWDDFVKEGGTKWTGVRNYQARNYLQAMKKKDVAFFYHSGDEKQIVGQAKVTREAYPDPTAEEPGWVAVDLAPVKPLARPVTLAEIKADKAFQDILLVRNSRLSVTPLAETLGERIIKLSQTK
jgi:predicted RNA-binding protein with PUA-like domain